MREQNEANLHLGMLVGTIDRVRDMLERLAPPQRTEVARALLPSLQPVEQALTRLRKFIEEQQ
jgi:hypothetical protein